MAGCSALGTSLGLSNIGHPGVTATNAEYRGIFVFTLIIYWCVPRSLGEGTHPPCENFFIFGSSGPDNIVINFQKDIEDVDYYVAP